MLKHSVIDVIASQKGSNGDRKLQFFGGYFRKCIDGSRAVGRVSLSYRESNSVSLSA